MEILKMKKIIAFVFTVVMIFSLINKANATTLTFDELTNEVGCWEIKDIYRNLG
jgi:hypothetical protein